MTVLRGMGRSVFVLALAVTALSASTVEAQSSAPPKVVIISLDGAQPALIETYLKNGVLSAETGLGRLRSRGVVADRNITATPSVTAVSHLAIATGSTASHNDIAGNSIHPVAGAIGVSLSGFGAPIGGYQIAPLTPSPSPTAEPLWVRLRQAGRSVVAATWPGADGADISIAGTIVQPAQPTRTVDYTVPFGAFGGLGAQGFTLGAANFVPAGSAIAGQLAAAGHPSFSPVQVTSAPIETFFCAPTTASTCGTQSTVRTRRYDIVLAALDSTPDGQINYDTLGVFDATAAIPLGPFAAPATGPAYLTPGGPSKPFFFEGSGNKIGAAFFLTRLAPDLSMVKLVRYGANFIPRNAPVIADVDDVNGTVGFWRPQPDFRIPERLSPGFGTFTDVELEGVYRDQVVTFVAYQAALARHAILSNPGADLVMAYIEQPDGSGHQFLLTDPRQPTDPLNPQSIGAGQDAAKIARYADHLAFAYRTASDAVEEILQTVGLDKHGEPLANVFVVSDHGMAPFHTAVRLDTLLTQNGINTSLLNIRTTGPATNIYVNLAGREAGGVVTPGEYQILVDRIASVLRTALDPNSVYNPDDDRLFSDVWTRPGNCGRPGFCTSSEIGQDSGDVMALMVEGYNFDGTQSPAVARLGDLDAAVRAVFSVPNFYGAHGHDSQLPSMSAVFLASGPDVKQRRKLPVVHNIDVAPTVMEILGVPAAPTVDGQVIERALK